MLRLILVFLSSIIFLNFNLSHAQDAEPSFEFDANEAVKWLPMPKDEAHAIAFPIFINGKKYNAILDTGSTGPISFSITERIQKELQLAKISEQRALAYGGRITSDVVSLPSIKVGGMTLTNQDATVIANGFYDGSGIDVVIRQTLLHSLLLQVDWQQNRLRFLLTGDTPDDEKQIPVKFREGTDHIFVPISLCGLQYDFILDTGLENAASINPRLASIKNCIGDVRSDITASGSGGRLTSAVVTVPKLSVGSAIFDNIISGLENPNGPLNERDIAGSIGYGLINRSNFILDIGDGKLEFYGVIKAQHIPARPTVGLQILTSSDILTISHIMSNSPAEDSKLRVGDKICKIDGQTIIENEYWTLNPKAGSELSLDMCNGENIKITARDFLKNHNEADINKSSKQIDLTKVGAATQSLGLCEDWEIADISLIEHCSTVIDSLKIPEYYKLVARGNRMQLYPYADRHEAAISDLNIFMEAQGETAPLLILRAESKIELARYEEAMADINAAIKIDINAHAAYVAKASLEYKLENYIDGIKHAEKAMSISPNDNDALNILALGYYYVGNFDKALSILKESFAIDDKYVESYILRALINDKIGMKNLASADYKYASNLSTDEANYAIKRWSGKLKSNT